MTTASTGKTSGLSIIAAVATGIMLLLFAAYVSNENNRRDREANVRQSESRQALLENHRSLIQGCQRGNALRASNRRNAYAIKAADNYIASLIEQSIDRGNVASDRVAEARNVAKHFRELAATAAGEPDTDCEAAFPAPAFANT